VSFEPSELPTTPILSEKYYDDPSIFTPENLLREARRQKGLESQPVPAICILDPDGDLVDYLQATGQAQPHPTWACYHTTLLTCELDGSRFGIIGRVVGAPFAVLVAEELFVSGCQLLISITSAGQLVALGLDCSPKTDQKDRNKRQPPDRRQRVRWKRRGTTERMPYADIAVDCC
jgi:hypothetical protein